MLVVVNICKCWRGWNEISGWNPVLLNNRRAMASIWSPAPIPGQSRASSGVTWGELTKQIANSGREQTLGKSTIWWNCAQSLVICSVGRRWGSFSWRGKILTWVNIADLLWRELGAMRSTFNVLIQMKAMQPQNTNDKRNNLKQWMISSQSGAVAAAQIRLPPRLLSVAVQLQAFWFFKQMKPWFCWQTWFNHCDWKTK